MTETRETNRFDAITDDGKVLTVIEYRKFVIFSPLSGPQIRSPGSRWLMLADGRDVNYIDATTFQIVETDEIIRKVE